MSEVFFSLSVIAETKSFARAAVVLDKVGEIAISARHLGRMAQEVGQRLVDEQHKRVELMPQRQLPIEVKNVPELAVVEMDGGRIRTRQEDRGSGTHEPRWRVKGTEKFWNDPSGANPILALRAASLCDDDRLEKLLTE